MELEIRRMQVQEYPLLKEFLWEAIFQQEDGPPLSKDLLLDPALSQYYALFGSRCDDLCICAEVDQQVIGAVWVRVIAGYGKVDAHTPEMAISLYPSYRGQGIGTQLIQQMLHELRKKGVSKVSLSVQKANPAWQLYLRLGFTIFLESGEEYLMVADLSSQ